MKHQNGHHISFIINSRLFFRLARRTVFLNPKVCRISRLLRRLNPDLVSHYYSPFPTLLFSYVRSVNYYFSFSFARNLLFSISNRIKRIAVVFSDFVHPPSYIFLRLFAVFGCSCRFAPGRDFSNCPIRIRALSHPNCVCEVVLIVTPFCK